MTTTVATTILDGARLLARHGGIVEVRILKTGKGTVSGYFDDLEALARAVAGWDGTASIYVTANPVATALLARAHNRLRVYARETTADKDIVRRAWFLVDVDSDRPTGISATNAEAAAAVARRNDVVAFLGGLDFPEPVLAMSGNGGHALWPVDLPNDEATTRLFERALQVLKARFTDNVAKVDEAVSNAARIWKLYGTMAVKGDAQPDRPHRRAELEHVPAELGQLEREALERLAAMAPAARTYSAPAGGGRGCGVLDLVGAFTARGLYRQPLRDGKHAVMCLWRDQHSGDSGLTETALFEPRAPGEPWGFDCKHAHCTERTIRDVLAVLGLSPNEHHDDVDVPYTFTPAVPTGHFLADYIAYASERTDAAHEFHEGAALILLAAATPGVKVELRQYPRGLGTNLYMLFVGPSTASRKSSAKDYGRDLHEAVLPDAALADLTSPEGFLEQLAKRSGQPSTWFIDEMGDLLDKLHHAKHMAGLRGCLLSLYDGRNYKYSRHTKRTKSGTTVEDIDWVRDPHLSLLGAATEAVFDTLTSADLTSGLLMRFAVIMPARKPARRPFEEGPETLTTDRETLTRRLHAILTWALTSPRRVTFAAGALSRLDTFAATMEATSTDLPERQRAMLRRLDAMTIKLGILVAAGRPETPEHDTLTVTLADADAALGIAERWRRDALAFANRIGETEFERHVDRCLRVVRGKRRVLRRVVAQNVHVSKRTLDDVEATLEDRGLITVERIEAKGRPARTTWEHIGGDEHA